MQIKARSVVIIIFSIWLLGKDWLFSSAASYPTQDSFAITLLAGLGLVFYFFWNTRLDRLVMGIALAGCAVSAAWVFHRLLPSIGSAQFADGLASVMPSAALICIMLSLSQVHDRGKENRYSKQRLVAGGIACIGLIALACLPDIPQTGRSAAPIPSQVRPHGAERVIQLKGGKVLRFDTGLDSGESVRNSGEARFINLTARIARVRIVVGITLAFLAWLIFASVLWFLRLALTRPAQSGKRALWIAGIVGLCSTIIIICAVLQETMPRPTSFLNATLMGTGLLTDAWDSYPLVQFVCEQGLITSGLVFLILLGAVVSAIFALYRAKTLEATHPEGVANVADITSAITLLSLTPICIPFQMGHNHSWLIGSALMICSSLVLLSAALRDVAPNASIAYECRRESLCRTCQQTGAILIGLVIIFGGMIVIAVQTVTRERTAQLPGNVIYASFSEIAPHASYWEFRRTLRRSLGVSPDAAPLSMASQLTGGPQLDLPVIKWCMQWPPMKSGGGLLLSKCLSPSEIADRYISASYPIATGGITSATQAIFHEPVSTLTGAQARYLICDDLQNALPHPSGEDYPQAADVSAGSIDLHYIYSPVPLAPGERCYHEGCLNDAGLAVGDIIDGGTLGSFTWSRHAKHIDSTFGTEGCYITGINNIGEMVGTFGGPAEIDRLGHPVNLKNSSTLVSLTPCAINNRSVIVGYGYEDDSIYISPYAAHTHAVEWKNGQFHDLGIPAGYISSRALAVNNSGQIVGWMVDRHGHTRAMLYDSSGFHDLGTFAGGDVSIATGIDDGGQIAGAAEHGDGDVTAFLWQAGRMHDLGKLPGDYKARAYAINNSGEVVGASYAGEINHTTFSHAFIWDINSGMRDVEPEIATTEAMHKYLSDHLTAYAVNNKGQILCACVNGTRQLLLLSPQ
jgi:probable HAF family extracellular repeat protein